MNKSTSFKFNAMWKYVLSLLLMLTFAGNATAQIYTTIDYTINISDISLIRINPYTSISMNLLASVAGETMIPKTNSSSYIQLTSIAPANQTRRIMATISSGFVPSGTLLTLYVANCSAPIGTCGTASGTITLLKNVNTTIINGIGSGYTRTTSTSGFNLTYTWQVDPAHYADLHAIGTVPITVTYTISSN